MGGHGSGRRRGWAEKGLTTDHRALDVRHLHREGILERHGERHALPWPSGAWVEVQPDRLLIAHRYRVPGTGAKWRDGEAEVRLDWTYPHYGGRRPWLRCPACARRVAKLYAGAWIACRRCADLAYPSQNEDLCFRRLRRVKAIRRRLGGNLGLFEPLPDKPNGMHWSTYERLLQELRGTQTEVWVLLVHWLQRADRRLAKLNLKY